MVAQTTFDQKSLHKILSDVPDGKRYEIVLKDMSAICQQSKPDIIGRHSYEHRVKSFIVYNGFIEIHKETIIKEYKNPIAKPTLTEDIFFIPFNKIDFIRYNDI